jgi:hypothetical protein
MWKDSYGSLSYDDFELYQQFCSLQSQWQLQVERLYEQFELCHCKKCKLNLVMASLELIELNDLVKSFEGFLVPELNELFNEAAIPFAQTINGTIFLSPSTPTE